MSWFRGGDQPAGSLPSVSNPARYGNYSQPSAARPAAPSYSDKPLAVPPPQRQPVPAQHHAANDIYVVSELPSTELALTNVICPPQRNAPFDALGDSA
jgi:hypothetical protein